MNSVMMKKLQMSLSGPRTAVSGLHKKQVYRKLPATMILMTRQKNGRTSRLMYPVDIISYNGKGVCITWQYCSFCSGYEQGRVHDNCMFRDFDLFRPDTQELSFNIEVPSGERAFVFRAKAVYTYKQNSGEKVGLSFTYIPDDTREYLDNNFRS